MTPDQPQPPSIFDAVPMRYRALGIVLAILGMLVYLGDLLPFETRARVAEIRANIEQEHGRLHARIDHVEREVAARIDHVEREVALEQARLQKALEVQIRIMERLGLFNGRPRP
jgi:hypothetical protein